MRRVRLLLKLNAGNVIKVLNDWAVLLATVQQLLIGTEVR